MSELVGLTVHARRVLIVNVFAFKTIVAFVGLITSLFNLPSSKFSFFI